MSNMPLHIRKYLNDRGISDETIEKACISWADEKIVMPVKDADGTFLFNKYRRSPDTNDDEPKYTYDYGSTAALYNSNNVNLKSTVFVVEGELDALHLMSYGLNAVSTTGGSGTFKEEWAEKLRECPEVFICYDRDEAGLKGMLKVNRMIPHAKAILLPDFRGKDLTDFILQKGFAAFARLGEESRSWNVPEPDDASGKAKQITEYNRIANEALDFKRQHPELRFSMDAIIEYALVVRNGLKAKKKSVLSMNFQPGGSRMEEAKRVPITDYLKFNKGGYANCIWHNEKTPSLKYYPEKNRVHCFGGCSKGGDVIDVVMAQHRCTTSEAISIILKS